jgi:hypothetical protein
MIFVGCMGALAIFGTSTTTANIVIVYFAQHGVLLATAATKYPKWINMLQGTWNEGTRFDIPATMGRGLGAALKALTLFTVWHFAGPTAFAAMMSFGVLVLHVLCDWAIVLYLIDLQQRAQDD